MGDTNKITFFASGNGDSVLLQAQGCTIMTDINYRVGSCQDENDDDAPDFAPDIRAACPNDHLDIFVLTHPDQDHLSGFGEIFHLGSPGDWTDDPEEGAVKIIVNEMWCSPYSVAPNYTTDTSKPVIDEITRRNALRGTAEGELDGNRILVLDASSYESGTVVQGVDWRLLAPTPEEANVPEPDDPDKPNSSNPTSLVIRWTITVGGKANQILLGGDSTLEVWERIHDEIFENDRDALSWHILLSPHHCSRRSIGRVENPSSANEKFIPSEKVETALSEQRGSGYVVASSNRVVRGGPTPPSFHAKNRYLRILARGGEAGDNERARFLCTSCEKETDKPEHVVFKFSSSGPSKTLIAAPFVVTTGAASGRGGGYG